jgi:hypothetical protein
LGPLVEALSWKDVGWFEGSASGTELARFVGRDDGREAGGVADMCVARMLKEYRFSALKILDG